MFEVDDRRDTVGSTLRESLALVRSMDPLTVLLVDSEAVETYDEDALVLISDEGEPYVTDSVDVPTFVSDGVGRVCVNVGLPSKLGD